MQATILCGGQSTRLRPVWEGAKSCVPVLGRPFIHWQLDRLEAAGITHVVLLTGHMRDDVMRAVDKWNGDLGIAEMRDASDRLPEGMSWGTGHSIRHACEKLESPSLLVYGDVYPRGDITLPLRMARNGRVVFSVSRATNGQGNVTLDHPGEMAFDWKGSPTGRVRRAKDYGMKSMWLEAGCMAIHPQYFRKLSPLHRRRLEDWLVAFCQAGIVDACEVPASLDVGTPEGLAECKRQLGVRDKRRHA